MILPVRGRAQFLDLRRHGHRARVTPLSVQYLPEPVDGPPHVAFAVGRRVGTAVRRNRVRRRLRAIARELCTPPAVLTGGTWLVIADADAARSTYGELTRALDQLVRTVRGPDAVAGGRIGL